MVVVPVVIIVLGILGGVGYWFWDRYLRIHVVRLAEDTYALLGGGGNTVVAFTSQGAVVVDPKFGLGARSVRRWLRQSPSGVRTVINTHYHYDHAQGNELYPGVEIVAHESTPVFMLSEDNSFNDPSWWQRHDSAMPNRLVAAGGEELSFDRVKLSLLTPGVAHTHGDLVACLPQVDVVATGDIFFNGFYPFFNGSAAGCSLPGMVETLRALAARNPSALFVPGHGSPARAPHLIAYANYLDELTAKVRAAIAEHLSEDQAVGRISVSARGYTWLPSMLGFRILIATARANVRWAYRILSAQGGSGEPA